MASPTFGPDPPELARRQALKRPEVPPPVVDGSNWLTHWLWQNNDPRSGQAYVPDQRMFSIPDLRPVLEDTPEQRIKFDPTAIRTLDTTPAFYLGQQDWKNDNAPTGRHEPIVRVAALPDGRYKIERICLETLTQQIMENDPRWIDPAMRDLAADLLTKAAHDEEMLGKITSRQLLTDTWEETPHRPLIVDDWNRRREKEADLMIKARHWSISNFPIWATFERLYDSFMPHPPTYKIADGPGGYENLSDDDMELRRKYVLEIDPKSPPDQLPLTGFPVQFWRRLRWKHESGTSDRPPGLPEGLHPAPDTYSRSML